VTRKATIAIAMGWTLAVTCLRSARLPNNFSTEHWLIDYRFGFVKRGLIGSLVALGTGLARTRPSEGLIDTLSIVAFAVFCAAILWTGLRTIRRAQWSIEVVLAVMVFLSSPFIVMSAHLIGYYDNIIIVLTLVSLALVFNGRTWAGAVVQSVAILVHENALLVGVPVFCWAGWLTMRQAAPKERRPLALLLPLAVFLLLTVRLSTEPHRLERLLTEHLSTFPFVAGTLADVRVPHWITISFPDSYRLHQGHFQERMLAQSLIGLMLPSLLALLGVVLETQALAAVSFESAAIVAICLVPQSMHLVAWDTSRIWTYSILCAFLVLWVDVELRPARKTLSQFVVFVSLVALFVNAIATTPLMDGLTDRLNVTTRLLLYAPVIVVGMVLGGWDRTERRAKPSPERVTLG